jgi:regulatory protein
MDEIDRAYEVSLRSLDYSARTTAEIRKKLEQVGFDEEIISQTITRLCENHLLDDVAFANRWVQDRADRKGYGRIRLAQELRNKGIENQIVELSLEDFTEEEEINAAFSLLKRKTSGEIPVDIVEKRRLFAFLQRRGYNSNIIEKVFDLLTSNNADNLS